MTARKTLIGYILLSYGPRHGRRALINRPGAGSQARRIEAFAAQLGNPKLTWAWDYARSPKGPDAYPDLFALLERLTEIDARGVVLVDGIDRLFRRLPAPAIPEVLGALKPHLPVLIDVSRATLLSDLDNAAWYSLTKPFAVKSRLATSPTRANPPSDGNSSTRKARAVSQRVRSNTADRLARQIADLHDELAQEGPKPSNVELARVANDKQLRTSRGSPWSDVTVARAIRRITKPEDGA